MKQDGKSSKLMSSYRDFETTLVGKRVLREENHFNSSELVLAIASIFKLPVKALKLDCNLMLDRETAQENHEHDLTKNQNY